jgi:hypothetical protein
VTARAHPHTHSPGNASFKKRMNTFTRVLAYRVDGCSTHSSVEGPQHTRRPAARSSATSRRGSLAAPIPVSTASRIMASVGRASTGRVCSSRTASPASRQIAGNFVAFLTTTGTTTASMTPVPPAPLALRCCGA